MESVVIAQNYISNFNQGLGMILDQSTCTVTQCITRDNTSGGIQILSSTVKSYVDCGEMPNDFNKTKYMTQKALMNMASNFRLVKIDRSRLNMNDRFGLCVKKFYGIVHLTQS